MTTFAELEQLAYQNAPMPEYKTEAEVFTFVTLRSLYRDYLAHRISKDQARVERRKIKNMFLELQNIQNKFAKHNREINSLRIALAKVSKDIETKGCPVCQTMMKIMDGRIPLKEESESECEQVC